MEVEEERRREGIEPLMKRKESCYGAAIEFHWETDDFPKAQPKILSQPLGEGG